MKVQYGLLATAYSLALPKQDEQLQKRVYLPGTPSSNAFAPQQTAGFMAPYVPPWSAERDTRPIVFGDDYTQYTQQRPIFERTGRSNTQGPRIAYVPPRTTEGERDNGPNAQGPRKACVPQKAEGEGPRIACAPQRTAEGVAEGIPLVTALNTNQPPNYGTDMQPNRKQNSPASNQSQGTGSASRPPPTNPSYDPSKPEGQGNVY